ncbi:hypothetical protein [uncultured Nostoc sp.]|uniref:hypothetical protein n=1 Tax=uncultured Nostoc sp. TaxID=340711 RepID=UPI0035CB2F1C
MNTSQSYSSFLPALNAKSRVSAEKSGEWDYKESVTFAEIADSLELADFKPETGNLSSIPDMWARPLLMDMVLRDSEHPLHEQMKAQWQGMLAAIALAPEIEGFKLQVELIDLDKFNTDPFIDALVNLIPAKDKTLYQLEAQKNPWKYIYVFLWQDKAVGMTSPSTLVCPSEDGNWTGIPWASNGKLRSPIFPEDELTIDEKEQLWHWLDNLLNELQRNTGNSARIKELIKEFQKELANSLGYTPNKMLRFSNKENYFGVPINSGALKALNKPIGAKSRDSSVQLCSQAGVHPLIIIPEHQEITEQWGLKEKDIWIYETTNLVSLNIQEFTTKYKVDFLTKDDIFLDDFNFITGKNNLPGACLPKGTESITYNVQGQEKYLTPLLPINQKLLKYFTPEELAEDIIELQPVNLGPQSGVRVKVNLPLSGGRYLIAKDYQIKEENAIDIDDSPYLEVWPNFIAQGWHEYYAFYFDDRKDKNKKTFRAAFPSASEIHPPDLQDFQIIRLDEFPNFIICKDHKTTSVLGLILLKTPSKFGDKDPNKTWIVGVDRGTSFTNVYYRSNREALPLTLSSLHLQITATDQVGRVSLLYEYFMSTGMEVDRENLPMATVLTTKGSRGQGRTVFDGRVYIPQDVKTFNPIQDHIQSDLKWSIDQLPFQRLFLKHLALLITAEAAKYDVRNIEWAISYPSAFSGDDNNTYKTTWQRIIEELGTKTGITHKWLPRDKGKEYRSESLALAHYYAEKELGQDIPYATCIDMGGGTSDISIWQGNKLVHQCSVQLAGKLLFSQFIKRKTKFLNEQFQIKVSNLTNHARKDDPFYVKLDALLLAEGEKWLEVNRLLFNENSDLQDIVRLSAIGISGLYYYVGILLQALHLEGKYSRPQITPTYIGGNGCRILNWLVPSGKFDENCDANRLFSRMLSKGSGFPDTRKETRLSLIPKAEVACGLVLDQRETRLQGLEQDDDFVIAGEDFNINGTLIPWTSRLRLEGEIAMFEVPELSNLRNFIDDFHIALQELRIKSIKPLTNYKDDSWREKLWNDIKEGVDADCLKITGDANYIRSEPPFILGLKSLLRVLAMDLSKKPLEDER